MTKTKDGKTSDASQLMLGAELLNVLFTPDSRPSLAFLRQKTADGTIPCVRVGKCRFYNIGDVRAALARIGGQEVSSDALVAVTGLESGAVVGRLP